MKKIFKRTGCVIALLATSLFSGTATAQTCGITSAIHVFGGSATVSYEADSSSLLPGWHIYEYRWDVNNNTTPIYGNAIQDIMPMGFNHLCLTMKATNPSTGDSCESQHCNIFFSNGDAPYPEFDVSTNGLTVDFNGTYLSPGFVTSAIYDFGDGTQSVSGSMTDSHTYPAPGDYPVCLSITTTNPPLFNGTAYGYVCRKVHVNNGLPNIEIGFINANTICDSVSLSVSSAPAFTAGYVMSNLAAAPIPPLTYGTAGPVELEDVPGSEFLITEAYDANAGYDSKPYLVFLQDCNIVPDTIHGTVYNDLNYNGIKEAGDPGIPNIVIKATGIISGSVGASVIAEYSVKTDTAGNYSILVPHHMTSVALSNINGYILTYPGATNYNVNFNSGTGHYNYNWGLSALTSHVCGTTYLDDNQDSVFTSSVDRILANVNVHVLNTITGVEYNAFSGQTGSYCIDLPPGNFVLKPVYYLLDSASYTPDSIIVSSPAGGNFYNRNFGFSSPVAGDPQVDLLGSNEARPGFDFGMTAHVVNSGFYNSKAELVLNYDPALTYVSHIPANGIVNTTAHTITWTTDSLKPAQSVGFSGSFNIPASVPLGTQLLNSATITPLSGFSDSDLTNNYDAFNRTVIGSFDPNDKIVDPEGYGANGDVHHETRLHYRINFQNTGTASAINIIVQDTIDANLDLNTLQLGTTSHNYKFVMNGRVLVWKFFNINLPDSNTNEPLSHGFIEYSISPVQGLPDGSTINNIASIYFDFNPPIFTNTTLNTLQTNITGVVELSAEQQLSLWPVPTGGDLFLLPHDVQQGHLSIQLYDMSGRMVKNVFDGSYLPGSVLYTNVSDLHSGVYLIRMVSAGSVITSRMVKE